MNLPAYSETSFADALPLMQETLRAGGVLCITAHGISMRPLLLGGEDVELTAPPDRLKKYDMAFYRRANGDFVLHRVIKVHRGGVYGFCGDNQVNPEYPVYHSQIIGVVTRFQSSGSWISVQNRAYMGYAKRKVNSRPLRKTFWMLYALLARTIKSLLALVSPRQSR